MIEKMYFDGRSFAREIEEGVRLRVGNSRPKVLSILVGDDLASALYSRLKKEAAGRCGIDFEIQKIDLGVSIQDLKARIVEVGSREDLVGVMVQMPIPGLDRESQKEVVAAIPLAKDVDGLRWEKSGIQPATVRAIMTILEKIKVSWQEKFVVVGDRGSVGKPLVSELTKRGVVVRGANRETPDLTGLVRGGEVVISCVGRAGLITKEMVKNNVILIDVGNSKVGGKVVGDMTKETYAKAAISVEVPGGVGPVTIASLMQNVVECAGY